MLLKAGTRLDLCGDASKGHRNLYRPLWNNWVPPKVFFWLEVLNRRIPLIMDGRIPPE
ncbi:hypothetical protein HanXRQr2_Chr05g0204201 [Helianthus annuus]|uniref:Uncharacterized protein n=1 Tax=Helianthus annuus TaxID=4232 RepID=A0A9K3IXN4_HELAN|nr:hypothetical protein HanXRQr2_Chr05g0204201 [Helianthus annuus]KAJ0576119.1 hypothetical protein HanIR_Chr05g0220581 [Helianthus annuus]KAJ0921884.1 hypothetical protein HanPSC8_Chr05g0196931 [Helianthus annuus]